MQKKRSSSPHLFLMSLELHKDKCITAKVFQLNRLPPIYIFSNSFNELPPQNNNKILPFIGNSAASQK